MTDRRIDMTLPDPDATRAFAARLGSRLVPGDTVLLGGDVGAGKTHLARSLIRSVLTTPEDVPSPTFTLVQTYDTEIGPVWHADLYRITSTSEIEELGLTDAFADAVCLIEWPDRLGDLVPPDALDITLSAGDADDARRMTVTWQDPKWDAKLAG